MMNHQRRCSLRQPSSSTHAMLLMPACLKTHIWAAQLPVCLASLLPRSIAGSLIRHQSPGCPKLGETQI